jgi:hypothetical protein
MKTPFPAFAWQPHPGSRQLTTWAVSNWIHSGLAAERIVRTGLRRNKMLWTITVILLVLWLLGVVGVYTVGSWIHILLVLAIISIIFNLMSGRRAL